MYLEDTRVDADTAKAVKKHLSFAFSWGFRILWVDRPFFVCQSHFLDRLPLLDVLVTSCRA